MPRYRTGVAPLTEEVAPLTEDGKRLLFEVRWSTDVDGFIRALLETRAKMLEGENIGDGWDFRLQFPSHDDLSEFRRLCDRQEVPRRLYNPHFPRDGNSMSTEQQEAILLVYERATSRSLATATSTNWPKSSESATMPSPSASAGASRISPTRRW